MTNVERSWVLRAFGRMGEGSLRGCTISLVFSALGAGVLTLPWALARLGILAGLGVLLASAAFAYASMEMLIASGLDRMQYDYADTMDDIIGDSGATIVNVVVAIDCAGAICVFLHYMATSVQVVATQFGFHISAWAIIVAMSFGVVLPLSLPRRITAVQKAAVASCVPLIGVVSLVVGRCPSLLTQAKVTQVLVRTDILAFEAAQACSAIFFSFMCHMNVWAVRNELLDPTERRTSKVLRRAVGVLFLIYALVGTAGALSFGNATPSDVLEAYPASDPTNLCVHGLMSAMLVVCSVLCVHPVRGALARLLGYQITSEADVAAEFFSPGAHTMPATRERIGSNVSPAGTPCGFNDGATSLLADCKGTAELSVAASKELSAFGRCVLTILVVATTCAIAIMVPSVVSILGVLGGFCAVALMFVFPTFIFARTRPGARANLAIVVTVLFSIIGVCAACYSVVA